MNIIINEKKRIEFNVGVSGVDVNSLKGALRLVFEGIEYGFPIEIEGGKVVVEIPPLKNIIREYKLSKGMKIDTRLDIIADDTFINPWNGELIVDVPVTVEATVKDEKTLNENNKPAFTLLNVVEKNIDKKKTTEKTENKKKSRFGDVLNSI